MKNSPNITILGIVFTMCLVFQLLVLSTQYVGRYDPGYSCAGDLVDCGPLYYTISTFFGGVEIKSGSLSGREQKLLDRMRLVGLIIPFVIEIAIVGVLIQEKRKNKTS